MVQVNIPQMVPLSEIKNRRNKTLQKMKEQTPSYVMCKLKGITGTYKDAIFPLDEDLTMGRDYHCANIVFPKEFEKISRAHCKLEVKKDGSINLIDLGSSNGTYLADGTKLQAHVPYSIQQGEYFYLVNKNEMFRII